MPKYTITIGFSTDRPLTDQELDLIAGQCIAQVEEPVDQNGEDMDVSVTHVLNTNLRGEPRHTWDW